MSEFQGHLLPRNLGVTSVGGGGGIASINGDNTSAQVFTVGTTGSDFNIVNSGGGNHVWELPFASAVNTGKLSSTDWSTFNSKISATITSLNADTTAAQLLTIGSAGTDFAITNPGAGSHVLNLPTASSVNTGKLAAADWSTFNAKIGGSGVSQQIAFFNGVSSVSGDTSFRWDTVNKRLAVGSDASLTTAGHLWDFSQTITDFSATAVWNPFWSAMTLNPLAAVTNYNHAFFSTQVQAGNTQTFARLQGFEATVQHNGNGNITGQLTNLEINSVTNGSGITTLQAGAVITTITGGSATGTIIRNEGLRLQVGGASASGTITTNVNLYIKANDTLGTISNNFGIMMDDMTFGTFSRAIELIGTGVGNAIRLGSSANIFANSANDIRFTDSTNTSGLDFGLTTTSTTINTITTANTAIVFQNNTFTSGVAPFAIAPGFGSENVNHIGASFSATQNGANANSLIGLSLSVLKTTGATTLATSNALAISSPTVSGTIITNIGIDIQDQSLAGVATSAFAIRIQNQSANATTTRAIELTGTGITNAIHFGASANMYGNAANNIRITDSTNVGGLDFNLTATTTTINTVTQDTASIVLQNQTFSPGTSHNAVSISPTWTSLSAIFEALAIAPTQSGANAGGTLIGLNVVMTKAAAATTLKNMYGINIGIPVITGTVTNSEAIRINDQTNANITNPRGIIFSGTSVANSIVWGASALQYANGANVIYFADATNTSGISLTLTGAAGTQTIGTFSGNLALASVTGIVQMTSARFERAKGANVASTNNIVLGIDGDTFTITGTTQINTISITGYQSGSQITLIFSGVLTVAHNTAGTGASIFLAGSTNFTTANNTILSLVYDGTQWQETSRKAA